MNLSNNLTLKEAIYSQTAVYRGISNQPTKEHLDNLIVVANKIFQPIRDHFDTRIFVCSGYRSAELNKAIKGSSKTSQHMKGLALDLDADVFGGVTNAEIFNFVKDNLEFSQLIWEYGNDDQPNWVHISYEEGKNIKKVMRCYSKSDYRIIK